MAQNIILIADSGATKTTWALVIGENKKIFKTQGMSPYFLGREAMEKILTTELASQLEIDFSAVQQVFFYGTGMSVAEKEKEMHTVLQSVFTKSKIAINHDLMGAARALCQHEKGIACILGTGSGACYFDGEKIRKISPGLGFILGDEGSGAYLGKILIQRYLYNELEEELMQAFDNTYHLTKSDILKSVYQEERVNRFLASFTLFLKEYNDNNQIKDIINTGFNDFFQTQIKGYENESQFPIHFVGGVAYAFQDELEKICRNTPFNISKILKEPIEGLVQFHSALSPFS